MKTRIRFILLIFSFFVLLIVGFLFFIIGKAFIPMQTTFESMATDIKFTVVIDAGHGGRDSGACYGGAFEKDLTLSISKKIKEFLSLYNVKIEMTRTDDRLLCEEKSKHKKRDDLLNRFKFATSFENQVFVSIHINKFPENKYKGLQVFYSVNDPFSESLALVLQSNAKDLLQPFNNRDIKRGNSSIYLLDRLECPAVLIECGFISNPEERVLLSDESYQNELAFVIANSIIEFLNI